MRYVRGAVVVLWVASIVGAAEAEWPGWRGPNRDGKSPDTGLLKAWPDDGPKLVWKVSTVGSGFSSVAVSGGKIYITGGVGGRLVLFAFDMGGKLQWKVDVDQAHSRSPLGSRATPMIEGGKLYLISGNGRVACLDASSGKEQWATHVRKFGGRQPGWAYAESVLIHKDMAIVKPGAQQGCIAALDRNTGELRWQSSDFAAGAEYGSSIAVSFGGKDLIITGSRSGIVCVDASDGALQWSNPWSANNTANCPTPAFEDGYVFWANGYGRGGICLTMRQAGDRVLADEAWTTRGMNCHHGGYIIHEGHIYGNHGGGWTCLELKTGERQWFERGVGKGSVCWADGMLYLFGENGGRVGLANCSPEGMTLKGRFRVEGRGPSWAHPVVIGGRLYIRYDTNLYCFDVDAK